MIKVILVYRAPDGLASHIISHSREQNASPSERIQAERTA